MHPPVQPSLGSRLPISLTPFIGREREIAELTTALEDKRLLTLVGPGGCGKTRLALKVAGELHQEFAGEIWWVDFAPLSAEALVLQTVAATLNVNEHTGQSNMDGLVHFLGDKKSLLVFDNCEHLIDACARLISTLLKSCPGVSILATSRENLRLPGEVVWSVPPLELPEPQPWKNPASEQEAYHIYQQSEAVQLFADRASAALASFELTPQNSPWISEICRKLDGMPLAIELAAARVRAFSVRQIAEKLADGLQLLSGGSRTAPARQQTLHATLDWSYNLLPNSEQILLQRLSVFSGGWILEAAEIVCAGDNLAQDEIPQLLANLVDKSLVVIDTYTESARYRLLETIRQYAWLKLDSVGQTDKVRDRHLDYFLEWAEGHAGELQGADQIQSLQLFEIERDNLRAAFEWCESGEKPVEMSLRLATACLRYWRLRGYHQEARERLATALARPGALQRTAIRAAALQGAAWIAYVQSDYPATRSYVEEALSIWEGLEPAGLGVAAALDTIGELLTEEGDYENAPRYFEDALAIYRKFGDKRGMGDMMLQLGWAAMRSGTYNQAGPLLEESLAVFRQLHETSMIALAQAGLGELAIRQGKFTRAYELLTESLALRRDLGDKWGTATALGSIGWAALLKRDYKKLRSCLAESIELRREISDQGGLAWCLEKLAQAVAVLAQPSGSKPASELVREAVRIYGAASALRAQVNSVIDPADMPEYERILNSLGDILSLEDFQEQWSEGGRLTLEQAVDLGMRRLDQNTEADLPVEVALPDVGGLTPRELLTAALVAEGKSNREIAGVMVVRVKTVETYITRIMNKLDFTSRVQIATWAVEKGIKIYK